MTVAYRPEDGWPVHLKATSELEADYQAWLRTACSHKETELRRSTARNGKPYFSIRCCTCDFRMGDWIPHKQIDDPESVPLADPNGPEKFEQLRRDAWKATQQKHLAIQGRALSEEYQNYLKSPEWRALHEKVMRRAGRVCEGCGDNPAIQVHHLSYAHLGNEFLWELVAICKPCHDRAHQTEKLSES